MRGLTRRWLLRPHAPATSPEPLDRRLLTARGLIDEDGIRRFCEPKLTDLHDPGLLPNIGPAAERLEAAVRGGETIVIYGDYDVDGITATAILYHIIKTVSPDADVRSYVPHRLDEGYGINVDAVRELADDGATVIVSVDCGVTAIESAAVAREVGVDLIITDHHNMPDGPLPEAFALVHPRLPESAYPFGDLCGAGVAFKLAWKFATTWCNSERVSAVLQRALIDALPLVALGTIADVVPLVDENRVLARFGLERIQHTPIEGLRALIDAADLGGEQIDTEKVGFVLAPRLNASGRMGHAEAAVRLLTTATGSEAKQIAEQLETQNRQRQATQRAILERASEMAIEAGMTTDDTRIIVLAHEDWHPGVVGIVCSRLTERFGRPAILMQRAQGECKGSARSIEGYSIHAAIESASAFVTRFGGHDAAAGLTLDAEQLDAFTAAITEHANANISVEELTPAVKVDCAASLDELDHDTVRRIRALAPFGRANPRPTLRIDGAVLAEAPRPLGREGRHLALRLRQDGPGGRSWIRVVWWNQGEMADQLAPGMPLDVLIEPKFNAWNGRVSVEGELRDVRIGE